MVTAYDSESDHPGTNPECMGANMLYGFDHCTGLTHSLHLSVVLYIRYQSSGTWFAEPTCNWTCKLIEGCSSRAHVRSTPSVASSGIYDTMKLSQLKIAWLYRDGSRNEIVSVTLHYSITLHYYILFYAIANKRQTISLSLMLHLSASHDHDYT